MLKKKICIWLNYILILYYLQIFKYILKRNTYLHKHYFFFLINIKIDFVIWEMFHLKVVKLFSFLEKTSVIGRCPFYRIKFKIDDSINTITWTCTKNIKNILLALLLFINYVCFLSLLQSDIFSLLPTVKFVKMTSTILNTDALNVFIIYCLVARLG